MFLLKKGKFEIDNVQFKIPDGFYLSGNPELVYDEEMYLYSPDKSYSVSIRRDLIREPLKEHLEKGVKYLTVISIIESFELNGLKGLRHLFKERRYQYFEAAFLPYDDCDHFITLEITTGKDIYDVISSIEFTELLNSFKKISS